MFPIVLVQMLYDPYAQPAIDIDRLATQCRNCIKPGALPAPDSRVWDSQNGRWIPLMTTGKQVYQSTATLPVARE